MSKILHLTLKKQWFDMIESGEKPEEYREIKPYWVKRLIKKNWQYLFDLSPHEYIPLDAVCAEHFDIIRFRNGYSKNAPSMDIEYKGLVVGRGNPKWGADDKDRFILSLGKILAK